MFCNIQNAMAYEAGLNCFHTVALAQSVKKSSPTLAILGGKILMAVALFLFILSPFVVLLFSLVPPAFLFYIFFFTSLPGVLGKINLVFPLTYENLRATTPTNTSQGRMRLALTIQLLFMSSSTGKEGNRSATPPTLLIPAPPQIIDHTCGYSLWLQASHNKMMHSLNGNIEGFKPVQDFLSSAIPALGGVRHVLTEYTTSVVSANLKEFWTPVRFPRQMTYVAANLQAFSNWEYLAIRRESEFMRYFPKTTTLPELPKFFTSQLTSIFAFFRRSEVEYHHVVTTAYDRIWEPKSPGDRPLQQRFSGLAGVLGGQLEHAALQAAERVGSINRFLDSRGNRQVERWEADQWGRWLRVANFAAVTNEDFSWLQCAFRLWARYFICHLANCNRNEIHVPALGTSIPLTFMDARPVTGPNAPNPEGAMWTDDAQDGLRTGRKQFIDAEGLSEEEIIELITCLVPLTDIANSPHLRVMASVAQPAGPKAAGSKDSSPTRVNEQRLYLTGPTRYLFPNEVDEIFIHYGNNPHPDAAAQQRIRDAVFSPPRLATVASVIRYLASKHNAIKDLTRGLEAVMYRSVLYASEEVNNKRNNLGAHQYINADGNLELHLPKDRTAAGYFDALRVPLEPTPELQYALAMVGKDFLHNAVLINHARAVSLNWAAFSISMLGGQWAHRPGTAGNQFVRNHVDVWLRQYGIDNINLWSTAHANAMAHQYGFAPSEYARSTEGLFVYNWWNDYQAPYLANPYLELWMMDLIPSHQILPFYDEQNPARVTWEEGRPQPLTDFMSFQNDVELGRDMSPFSGRTWMADGGMTRNAQFYVAQGRANQFRFEGGQPCFKLANWASQYQHQFPQNPTNQDPVWMGPINTPFADFLLPGSLPALRMDTNRVYSWGVRLGQDPERNVSRRWHSLTLGEGEQSLMINYLHPLKERRQIEALHDYSIFIWEKDSKYAGMTAVRYDLPDIKAGARFDPSGIPSMPNYDIPAARGDEYRSIQPSRVARTRRVARTQRKTENDVASGDENPRVKVTRYLSDVVNDNYGSISYTPKYPRFEEEVPHLPTADVTMDSTGIRVDPVPLAESQTPLDRLAFIEKRLQAVDAAEKQMLAEEKAKLHQLREEAKKDQREIATRVANSTKKAMVARRRFTNPEQATYLNPGMQARSQVLSNISEQATAVPNDANSGQAQGGLAQLNESLQGYSTLENEFQRAREQAERGGQPPPELQAGTDFEAFLAEHPNQPVSVTGSLPRTVYSNSRGLKRKSTAPTTAQEARAKQSLEKGNDVSRLPVPGQADAAGNIAIDHSQGEEGLPHASYQDSRAWAEGEQRLANAHTEVSGKLNNWQPEN